MKNTNTSINASSINPSLYVIIAGEVKRVIGEENAEEYGYKRRITVEDK
ncbi:MAG: hypothetical protein LKF79_07655 [Solobacterium sp.]|jgi:hypothetical protein|nr:hypothetical protein [Solobacterium sp.]